MRSSSGDSSSSGRVGPVHGVAIPPSVRGNQRIVSTAVSANLSPSTPTERRFTRNTSPAERCFSRSCSTQILCSVSHRSLLSSIEPTKRCSTRYERWKPRFTVASPSSGINSSTQSLDQHRSTNLGKSVRDSKAETRRETAVIAAGHPGLVEHAGRVG